MNAQTPVIQMPFHKGEEAAQERAGMRETMATFGKIAIRPFMPDQHRKFYEQLPFVVLGSVDPEGWPWASILVGGDGFIASPTDTRLDLGSAPLADDPLSTSMKINAPIGLLGIEVATRRRNRMNAKVISSNNDGTSLEVVQSFGNCPQYIQTRDINFIRKPGDEVDRKPTDHFSDLDAAATAFIQGADTFFVSSYAQSKENPDAEGADVSHRGGREGFVKVEGNTLTIPDYSGNNFFNTIGNFLVNPKAGLIFPDFATGDVLMLTGTVEVLWEDHPEVTAFKGAERGWRFTLDHGIRIHDALPFRADFGEWSPNSLMADDWATSQARQKVESQSSTWRALRVTAIKNESSVIRSFTFEAANDEPLPTFEAGQFLTIRSKPDGSEPLTRTYTVSSAPGDAGYRISVKREPEGLVSNHLHGTLKVGDVIEAKAPKGAFCIDALEHRPAVLLAGGVGVTPMISMTRHVLNETVSKRFTRPLTVFHAAQTTDQRAFADEFRAAQASTNGKINYISVIDQPTEGEAMGIDFDATGFIDANLLREHLALDDYDYFLCGPPPFMQAVYDALRDLGARDARIFAEAFGPASLTRRPDAGAVAFEPEPEAEMAVVKFEASGFEQRWEKGDATLLETAEAHGLTPAFSCRAGSCGSCATKKHSGNVAYRTPVTAEHADDEVLICCAVPAAGTDELVLDL
ncbi:MAG: ferredoxin-NADP reductase [Candidatus Azotimanducaceae bacterium]|jgi:ferredoxin-NADP reductase/predicted pyridoxine 5'-phosphate oxidase superfamily flavin-nucleotide-binding protein